MNREQVIKIANDMAVFGTIWIDDQGNEVNDLVKFAQLVETAATEAANARSNASWTLMCEKMVAAEREACAKVCDEQQRRSAEASDKAKRQTDAKLYHHCAVTASWNAAAIRARGQQ